MSSIWEDINICDKKFGCDLDIYFLAVLSSSYGIIMDFATNAHGRDNNVIDVINATGNK